MSEISSEAVEAAAQKIADWLSDTGISGAHRDAAKDALTAALPYLSPRVVPSAEEVADLRRQLATAQAVVRDLQRQPTVAEVREQVAREIEKARNAALNDAYETGDQGKAIYSDGLLDAARIARGETKGGE